MLDKRVVFIQITVLIIAISFFRNKAVDHGDLGLVNYPTTWAKLSRTPLTSSVRAPFIGEHNELVLGDTKESPDTASAQS